MAITPLKPDALYQRCLPEQFDFETTAELEDLGEVIGQPRAVDAVRFGIGIRQKGYNLFALGPTGTGKHALVQRYAAEQAKAEPVPPDWCYVNNFQQRHELRMPAGRGVELERDMDQLVEDLHAAIPTVFESEEYRTRSQAIEGELSEQRDQAIKKIQANAEKKEIALFHTPTGFTLAPVRKESLRHLNRLAVARVIEHSARLLEDCEKLLTHARSLTDMLREADYRAAQNRHETISCEDVQQAIDARSYRVEDTLARYSATMQARASKGEKTYS